MQRRRILIVDDNEDIAMALGALLEFHGYRTFVHTDGSAALETAKAERPDVILMDLELPGLSGYEICLRVREEPWAKNALIVAITGWTREKDRVEAWEAGFDHYLIKPVEFTTLRALLERGVSRRPGSSPIEVPSAARISASLTGRYRRTDKRP